MEIHYALHFSLCLRCLGAAGWMCPHAASGRWAGAKRNGANDRNPTSYQ